MANYLKLLPLFVYTFLFIYMPMYYLPFNIIHLLAIIAYLFLFLHSKYITRIFKEPALKSFNKFQLLSFLFIIAYYIVDSGEISIAYSSITILFEVIPIAIFISLVIRKNLNKNLIYDTFLIIGLLQVGFVIITFFSPSIRNAFLLEQYKITQSELIFSSTSNYRLFGLGRNLTYAMPLFQGICIIIAIVLGIYNSKKYLILVPFFIFSIALNARVGFLSFVAIGLASIIFLKRGIFLKTLTGILLTILFIYFFAEIVSSQASKASEFNTWVWLDDGFKEMQGLQSGQYIGNLEALTTNMWFLPENDNYFLGTGEVPFRRQHNNNSDIGYVQLFYYGGLIFSLLTYLGYIFFFSKILKKTVDRRNELILTSTFLLLFLSNFKGNAFNSSEFTNGIILLLVYSSISQSLNYKKNPV